MNSYCRIAAPLALWAAAHVQAAAQPPAAAPAGDQGPTAAVGAFVRAFNSHDAAALGRLWGENALHVSDDDGERLDGRAAIVQAYDKLFATDPKCELTLKTDSSRPIAPTVASVDGVANVRHTDGQTTSSAVTAILVQRNGHWLVDQVHERDLPGIPSSAPQLAALAWLAGEWTGQLGDSQVVLDLDWAPNMGFMMGRLEHRRGGATTHEVFHVVGWDAEQQCLRSWQFSGDGGFAEGVWQPDGDHKWLNKLVAKFPDGRRGSMTHALTRISDDQLTLQTLDREVDGEPQPNTQPVTLSRSGPSTTKPGPAQAADPAPAAKPQEGAAR